MEGTDGRLIRYYIVRTTNGNLAIHERTDKQMDDWLKANPGELVTTPFETREAAEGERERLQKSH